MKIIKYLIILKSLRQSFTYGVVLLYCMGCAHSLPAKSADSLDRILINSLMAKDINAARRALIKGANPEAVIGKKLSDHAMCTAIDDRSSKYLELLVEFGASPNAYWYVGYGDRRTPLACAIYLWNFEAFYYLLEHGADPSVNLHRKKNGDTGSLRTALYTALSGRRFPMALALVKLYDLQPDEIKRLVFDFERHSYSKAHPWSYAHEELVEWTRERVTDFHPKAAPPIPIGFKRKCLFTFRDHEEGLKKGTLCWETDDQ